MYKGKKNPAHEVEVMSGTAEPKMPVPTNTDSDMDSIMCCVGSLPEHGADSSCGAGGVHGRMPTLSQVLVSAPSVVVHGESAYTFLTGVLNALYKWRHKA